MRSKTLKWKWMVLLAAPVAFLLAMGCDETDDPIDKGASGEGVAAEADVAPGAAADSRRMGKRGRDGHGPGRIGHKQGRYDKGHSASGKLLRYALQSLDLTDDQRATLEALRESDEVGPGPKPRNHRADFHAALVEALETGELDRAALEAKLTARDELIEKKIEARNAKLAKLHATLTPEQRQTLVDAVRAKLDRKADKRGDWGDRDRPRKDFQGKRGPHGMGKLQHMLQGIELTPEQQARIDALAAKGKDRRPTDRDWAAKQEQKRAAMNTLLDAFVTDDFDPAMSAPEPEPMKDPMDKLGLHIEQVEAVLGILTAEQRAQLAEQIKNHPRKMWHHGKGMKGCACGGECEGDCPGDCPKKRQGDCPFANPEN